MRDGSIWSSRKSGPARGKKPWVKLKPYALRHGHLVVAIKPSGKKRLVHHLILETFVGPCPPGMECRHFPDRNPANNRLNNIQWGTNEENHADRIIHGTSNRGEQCGASKLTEEQVRSIRSMSKGEWGWQSKLASELGITPASLCDIIKFRTWKHVTDPFA